MKGPLDTRFEANGIAIRHVRELDWVSYRHQWVLKHHGIAVCSVTKVDDGYRLEYFRYLDHPPQTYRHQHRTIQTAFASVVIYLNERY